MKKIIAKITLETSIDFNTEENIMLAKEQIGTWIMETLGEEERIPLFIESSAGETTGPVKIEVGVE